MSKKQIFVSIKEINEATDKQDVKTAQTLLSDVKDLLKADRSIVNETNESQYTPIIIATVNKNSNVELIKLLIDAGADVKATTRSGQTPLILAAQNGHDKIVELLLGSGADAKAIISARGISALFMAAQNGHDKVVELLLGSGADAKTVNAKGISVLYVAAQNGHNKIVELLLGAGADTKAVNARGISALYVAAQKGYDKIVELIAKAEGADLKLSSFENSSLSQNVSLDSIASGKKVKEQYSDWNDEYETRVSSPITSANNSNDQSSSSLQELITQQQIRDENNQDDVNSIGHTTYSSTLND